MATLGSRSTYHMGHAVKRAAEDARDKLFALAAELGLAPETTPIPELFRKKYGMQAGNVIGMGRHGPLPQPPGIGLDPVEEEDPRGVGQHAVEGRSVGIGKPKVSDIEERDRRSARLTCRADRPSTVPRAPCMPRWACGIGVEG